MKITYYDIISSYELYHYYDCYGTMDFCDNYHDELSNEKQINKTEIYIYRIKFYKKGIYTIIFKFKQPLESAAYLFWSL